MNQQAILTDFIRRYDQSFIHTVAPGSTEENLFFVQRITLDAKSLATFDLVSPEYGRILLNYGTAHTLKFKYPPVGVFQRGKDAYIFRRLPQRQWKVGLCQHNCSCTMVLSGLVATHNDGQLSFEQVVDAYASEKYTYRDALRMLKSGRYRSVALHNNFTLSLSVSGVDQHMLLYWETPVAMINIESGDVTMLENAFESVIGQVKGS